METIQHHHQCVLYARMKSESANHERLEEKNQSPMQLEYRSLVKHIQHRLWKRYKAQLIYVFMTLKFQDAQKLRMLVVLLYLRRCIQLHRQSLWCVLALIESIKSPVDSPINHLGLCYQRMYKYLQCIHTPTVPEKKLNRGWTKFQSLLSQNHGQFLQAVEGKQQTHQTTQRGIILENAVEESEEITATATVTIQREKRVSWSQTLQQLESLKEQVSSLNEENELLKKEKISEEENRRLYLQIHEKKRRASNDKISYLETEIKDLRSRIDSKNRELKVERETKNKTEKTLEHQTSELRESIQKKTILEDQLCQLQEENERLKKEQETNKVNHGYQLDTLKVELSKSKSIIQEKEQVHQNQMRIKANMQEELQHKIEKLQGSVESLKRCNELLKGQEKELKNQIENINNNEILVMKDEISNLKTEVEKQKDLENKISLLKEQNRELELQRETTKSENDGELATLKDEIDRITYAMHEQEQEYQSRRSIDTNKQIKSQQKIKEMTDQIESLESLHKSMREKADEMKIEMEYAHSQQLGAMRDEIASLENSVAELKSTIEEGEKNYNIERKTILKEQARELRELGQRENILEEQLTQVQRENQQLDLDRKKLKAQHRDEVKTLSEELKKITSEFKETENVYRSERSADAENQIKLNQEINEIKGEMKVLKTAKKSLEDVEKELKRTLEHEKAVAREERANLEKNVADLKSTIHDKDTKLDTVRETNRKVNTMLEEQSQELRESTQRITIFEGILAKIRNENKELELEGVKTKDNYEEQLHTLRNEMRESINQFKEKECRYEKQKSVDASTQVKSQQKIQQLKEQIKSLQSVNNTLQGREKDLKKQLKKETTVLKGQISSLESTITELESSIEKSNQLFESEQKTNFSTNAILKEQTRELTESVESKTALEGQINQLRDENQKLDQELKDEISKITSQFKEKEIKYEKQIFDDANNQSQANKEIREMKQQVKSLEQVNKTMEGKKRKLEEELELERTAMRKERESLETTITELKSTIDDKDQNFEIQRNTLVNKNVLLEEQTRELNTISERKLRLEGQVSQLQDENKTLVIGQEKMKDKYDNLLDSLKDEMNKANSIMEEREQSHQHRRSIEANHQIKARQEIKKLKEQIESLESTNQLLEEQKSECNVQIENKHATNLIDETSVDEQDLSSKDATCNDSTEPTKDEEEIENRSQVSIKSQFEDARAKTAFDLVDDTSIAEQRGSSRNATWDGNFELVKNEEEIEDQSKVIRTKESENTNTNTASDLMDNTSIAEQQEISSEAVTCDNRLKLLKNGEVIECQSQVIMTEEEEETGTSSTSKWEVSDSSSVRTSTPPPTSFLTNSKEICQSSRDVSLGDVGIVTKTRDQTISGLSAILVQSVMAIFEYGSWTVLLIFLILNFHLSIEEWA